MYNEICTLLSMRQTVSPTGDPIEEIEDEKEVFCRIYSADSKEKSVAATRGKSAEIVIEIADRIDYSGERFARVRGAVFEVIDEKFGDTSDNLRLVMSKWDYR